MFGALAIDISTTLETNLLVGSSQEEVHIVLKETDWYIAYTNWLERDEGNLERSDNFS